MAFTKRETRSGSLHFRAKGHLLLSLLPLFISCSQLMEAPTDLDGNRRVHSPSTPRNQAKNKHSNTTIVPRQQNESTADGNKVPGERNSHPPSKTVPVVDSYSWNPKVDQKHTLANRVATPNGFVRTSVSPKSFARWLRTLPVKVGRPEVLLYDQSKKINQSAHALVIDIDTGSRDLQQCADAVMRLRAEYLYSHQRFDEIHFNFTTGDRASYLRWRNGVRPRVENNQVSWVQSATRDNSYAAFRKYLTSVFTYAGTASLSRELKPRLVPAMESGDVFILGGYPGHAVIVVDMAYNPKTKQTLFLLAQSYMPAQDMHLLRNPRDIELSPWYSTDFGAVLITPEWEFDAEQLMHFVD